MATNGDSIQKPRSNRPGLVVDDCAPDCFAFVLGSRYNRGMSDEPKKRSRGRGFRALITLFVLYPLSIGPVSWFDLSRASLRTGLCADR